MDKEANKVNDEAQAAWRAWRNSGFRPEGLRAVLETTQLRNAMNAIVTPYKGNLRVDNAALENEAYRQAAESLPKYNPDSGIQLNTFLTSHVRLNRFAGQHSNFTRMPDQATQLQGVIGQARQAHLDEHGSQPSIPDLVARIRDMGHRASKTDVLRAIQGNRKDLSTGQFQETPDSGIDHHSEEILALLPDELPPDELQVFNLLYGRNGSPKVPSTGQIAKRLKMSDSAVSSIKARIAARIRKYV
ncbi:sigma-70 family RNA polymerase sigma factor [bacterium]|nr:sigma-70 family RNA polymerase sigma factor [bacterium]